MEFDIKTIESVQKDFLRSLYCKEFAYYDISLTYGKLVAGYECTFFCIRRKKSTMKFLNDLINGKLDSASPLSGINIHAPSRMGRSRGLFVVSKICTNILQHAPLERMKRLYNKLTEIVPDIDIFSDTRHECERNVCRAPCTIIHLNPNHFPNYPWHSVSEGQVIFLRRT